MMTFKHSRPSLAIGDPVSDTDIAGPPGKIVSFAYIDGEKCALVAWSPVETYVPVSCLAHAS